MYRGHYLSLPVKKLSAWAILTLILAGAFPRPGWAAPQEEEEEEVVVEPPELLPAVIRSPEPVCQRPSTILCEDFENPRSKDSWSDYEENGLYVQDDFAFGGKRSLSQRYARGQVVAGWLGWHFGDHPEGGVRSGEKFEDVYFRFYHRFKKGWPDRFPPRVAAIRSRYVDGGLRFAWQEQLQISARLPGGTAASRPISGLAAPDGKIYLGDGKLRWLDKKPLDLQFAELDGEWVLIELRIKLNTPGQNDGRITYWVNEEVVLDREGENLRGAYTATTINSVLLEGYWNSGAPVDDLERWYDNVVVATEPVGCAVFTVKKKKLDDQSGWQVQVATDEIEAAVVWDSGEMAGSGVAVDISEAGGTFAEGADRCLLRSTPYVMRARHAVGETWSDWSEWMPLF